MSCSDVHNRKRCPWRDTGALCSRARLKLSPLRAHVHVVVVLAGLVVFFLPFTSADAHGSARAEFSSKATNGYIVSVEGRGRQVALTAAGHGGRATYSVRGRASTRQVKGRFGKFGRIALRFEPRGKSRQIKPPKHCKGRSRIRTEGDFVGTIRFRGERGYTRLTRKRVRGSTLTPSGWRCKARRGDSRSISDVDFPQPGLGVPALGAFTPNGRVVFTALGFGDPKVLDLSFFLAGTKEHRGVVRIARFALVEARSRAFAVQPDLAGATVRPPKPFSGTASFARDASDSTSWTGTLAVALPGAGTVPLTGTGFAADLAKPKTFAEYAALLGQPTSSLARRR
jgi:hypothetical protein